MPTRKPARPRATESKTMQKSDAMKQVLQQKGTPAPGLAQDVPSKSYGEALNEGMRQAMELHKGVVVIGQLVDYAPGVFGSTTGLVERFGADRVRDFPVSESAMTAAGIGAALAGCRPVLVHHRL